jgi:hypothetical protein
VAVGVGVTGAPPEVVLEVAGVVCVTDVVVLVTGLVVVPVAVGAAPVVVDWVVDEDVLRECVVVVVDELWLDPPHAARANASTTTAAATTATRARSPEHRVRCMS